MFPQSIIYIDLFIVIGGMFKYIRGEEETGEVEESANANSTGISCYKPPESLLYYSVVVDINNNDDDDGAAKTEEERVMIVQV